MDATPAHAWAYAASGGLVSIGMLAICWAARRRYRAPGWVWAAGTCAWLLAVLLKVVAAGAVFFALYGPAIASAPAGGHDLRDSIVAGLLTGIFECGTTIAFMALTRLRRLPLGAATTFGVAFGAFEAIVLAVPIALVGLAGLWIERLSPDDAAATASTLADAWRPLTFGIERFCALPVHVLSCLWIAQAVQRRRLMPFVWAFLLKTAIDAVPTEGQLASAVLEGTYLVFGVVALVLLARLSVTDNVAVVQDHPAKSGPF